MAEASNGAPARATREPRHKAREAAVQMLYQWEVGRQPMPEVATPMPAQRTAMRVINPWQSGQ